MTDHDHSGCFRTSDLYNPCTLLELMAWADQMHVACVAGRVVLADDEATKEWLMAWHEEAGEDHSFLMEVGHLNVLAQMLRGAHDSKTEADLMPFLEVLFHHSMYPMCTWDRIMVDMAAMKIKTSGFAFIDGLLWMKSRWRGFPEVRQRDESDNAGQFFGCPTTFDEPPLQLVDKMCKDKDFMPDFIKRNLGRLMPLLAENIAEAAKPGTKITKSDVYAAFAGRGPYVDAVHAAIRPLLLDMLNEYMLFSATRRE